MEEARKKRKVEASAFSHPSDPGRLRAGLAGSTEWAINMSSFKKVPTECGEKSYRERHKAEQVAGSAAGLLGAGS